MWQILHDAGIGPAPRRTGPTWKQFLTARARGIIAVDFVHVDTVLLRRIHALIVQVFAARRVEEVRELRERVARRQAALKAPEGRAERARSVTRCARTAVGWSSLRRSRH